VRNAQGEHLRIRISTSSEFRAPDGSTLNIFFIREPSLLGHTQLLRGDILVQKDFNLCQDSHGNGIDSLCRDLCFQFAGPDMSANDTIPPIMRPTSLFPAGSLLITLTISPYQRDLLK
jgi:hypothetical protein